MSRQGAGDAARVNYYDILQVSPTASQEVIQAAYRALAREYHPDVNPDAHAARRMGLLNKAYDVLGDSQRRAQYDLLRTRASRVVTARPPTPASSRGAARAHNVRGVPPAGHPREMAALRAAPRTTGRRGSLGRSRLVVAGLAITAFVVFVCMVLWAVSFFLDDSPSATANVVAVTLPLTPLNRFLTAAEHPVTIRATESGHDAISA
jgi:hypothetical protein